MPSDRPIELLQFPYSHYNEKARWAFDYKNVAHTRTSFLPGPHAPAIKRLSGQTMVPIARFGDELVCGSDAILETLERLKPEPALYPADEPARNRALEIQRRFDAEVGPMVRRAIFSVLIRNPGYLCSMFSGERSLPVRAFYRASFPIARMMMRRAMGIAGPASVDEAIRATEAALDFVARESNSDGFLAGDRFSVADLTAASLLAPAVNPPDSPMELPAPVPRDVASWHARWREHPGSEWVRACYRRHRPRSAASRERCAPLGAAA